MNQERAAKLLADASCAGVYHLPHGGLTELRAAAKELRFVQFRVRLDAVRDKAGFLSAVSQALTFPAWFGHNWDALEDCLTDLSWQQAPGYLVSLSHADEFHAAEEPAFRMALRIFEAAADHWREDGIPFWTLVDLSVDPSAVLRELP
jgi:RNAse (barnase) inhibitor barstar